MANPNDPVKYRQCDVCPRYSDKLSARGWCQACEAQFTRLAARLKLIRERSRMP